MEKECFKCKKCDICFPTSRKLRTHSQTMHPKNPKEVKPGIICKIKACGQSFESADALAKHQQEPHYKCDCGEAYHKPNELLRHKREDYCRYLVCERCDINYLDAEPAKRHTYAKDHYRSCSERSFVCDKCGFRTHTANLLKRHQQIHTAERVQKRELSRLNFLGGISNWNSLSNWSNYIRLNLIGLECSNIILKSFLSQNRITKTKSEKFPV